MKAARGRKGRGGTVNYGSAPQLAMTDELNGSLTDDPNVGHNYRCVGNITLPFVALVGWLVPIASTLQQQG